MSAVRAAKEQFSELLGFGKTLIERSQNRVLGFLATSRQTYRNGASWLNTPWSLQAVVQRDEEEWGTFNRHRKALALSRIEREFLFAGEHPVRFSASLLTLVGSMWALAQVLPTDWFVASWGHWQSSEQLAHFSTLWAVQATLAALVYPIVIAFVTVFLQRRPAAEAFVHLYILDSGALAAGLSSLTLVLAMALQYVLVPTYGTAWLPMWVALDAGWFLVNAALTTYFLFRTVEFLRPEVQQHVVRRYAVNIALPRDVMRLNCYQVLAQAQGKGWIPAPGQLDNLAQDGPRVLLSRFGFREGEVQGIYHLQEPASLVNVRLLPLRLVVASWMRAARKWPVPEGTQPARRNDWPLLELPMMPGALYRESTPLAIVSSGPPLVGWQRKVLRFAYIFRPTRKERFGVQVKSILEELEIDARVAAGRPDAEAFERAYGTLVGLHELLLGASLAKGEDGTVSSWALLPDIHSFAERALYQGWADIYRSIFLAAIGAMVNDTRPIRRLCHLVQHLNGDDLRQSPVEIRENLLQLPPLMMYQLGGWWARRVEEQGIMEHGHHQMVVLRAPLHRVYEEVISTFVAGWENARTSIVEVPDAREFDWGLAPELSRLNSAHIQETSRMLLAAVARGDRIAAEWLADVLGKWWGPFSHDHGPFALYDKTEFLTLEHVKLDWRAVSNLLGLTERDVQWSGNNVKALQRAAFLAALENYWTDIRLIVVELLLAWAGEDQSLMFENSLAMEIATGMLTGKQWRGGGTLSSPLSGLSAATYLSGKVRQYAADGKSGSGYAGRLSGFVERVKDIERPEMVSSRVYSFSGADDIDSLQEQQFILLAALSEAELKVSKSLRRQVDIWISQQYTSIDVLRRKANEWSERLEKSDELAPRILPALLQRTEKPHDAVQGRTWATQGIESLKVLVEGKREEMLAAEPVDPERLDQIARFASSKAFQPSTGEFPLQLFGEVKVSKEVLQGFTLTMKQVRKGELTRTEMDQRAVNEDEFWAESMAGQIGVVVLKDVLVGCKQRDVFVPDAESYWVALKAESARIKQRGQHPVLILDNATRPEWVWQWQHADYGGEYTRPDDLRVQRLAGRGDDYICNFNDIEIFVAPLPAGQSILLAREAFRTLVFTEFAPERFVAVSVDERSDSKLLLDLKLTFSRRVEVGASDVTQLDYTHGPRPRAGH